MGVFYNADCLYVCLSVSQKRNTSGAAPRIPIFYTIADHIMVRKFTTPDFEKVYCFWEKCRKPKKKWRFPIFCQKRQFSKKSKSLKPCQWERWCPINKTFWKLVLHFSSNTWTLCKNKWNTTITLNPIALQIKSTYIPCFSRDLAFENHRFAELLLLDQ